MNPQFFVITSTGYSENGKELTKNDPKFKINFNKPKKGTQEAKSNGSVLPIFVALMALVILITWLRFSHETYVVEQDDFFRNFDLLNLPVTASKEEVEKQFRKLAKDMFDIFLVST